MEKLSALLENTAETIEDADAALVEKVAPSDKAAVQALSLIGEIGDQPPMRALCASIIIFGLIRRDAKLTLAGVRMLTAHTIATKAKNVLKKRVDRVRPDARVFLRGRTAVHAHAGACCRGTRTPMLMVVCGGRLLRHEPASAAAAHCCVR